MKRGSRAVWMAIIGGALFLAGCSLFQTASTVDFTVSSTEGRAPLAVRFTPEVDGAPTAYSWSFGDGETSSELSPIHVYSHHGTYSVMLTVEFADRESSIIVKKRLICVDTPLMQASQEYLYWLSGYRVWRGVLGGSESETLANNWQPPSGLDVAGGRVYWVWTDLIGGVIESAALDGSDRRKVVEEENRLGDVAVDVRHGKMYWTSLPESPRSDFETGSWDGGIRCANLDGSNVETLLEYPAGSATYADRIVIDPVVKLLAWSVVGDGYEGAIQTAYASPFLPVDLVSGIGHVHGMTLDTIKGVGANNIYYTTGDELRRVGLYWYGSASTILEGLDAPSGVAVDPISYYVYIGTSDGILRAVTDGTNAEIAVPEEQGVGSVVLPR